MLLLMKRDVCDAGLGKMVRFRQESVRIESRLNSGDTTLTQYIYMDNNITFN